MDHRLKLSHMQKVGGKPKTPDSEYAEQCLFVMNMLILRFGCLHYVCDDCHVFSLWRTSACMCAALVMRVFGMCAARRNACNAV